MSDVFPLTVAMVAGQILVSSTRRSSSKARRDIEKFIKLLEVPVIERNIANLRLDTDEGEEEEYKLKEEIKAIQANYPGIDAIGVLTEENKIAFLYLREDDGALSSQNLMRKKLQEYLLQNS